MQADHSVYVIDGDEVVRRALGASLAKAGLQVRTFVSAAVFLGALPSIKDGCIVADLHLPDMSGFSLLKQLRQMEIDLPVILASARGTIPLAVQAMRTGASDFLEKPLDEAVLIASICAAVERHRSESRNANERVDILQRLETLSMRERQVLEGLVAGHPNKIIAFDLGISIRTIELYRSHVMAKMKAASLSELVRMAVAGGVTAARKKAG